MEGEGENDRDRISDRGPKLAREIRACVAKANLARDIEMRREITDAAFFPSPPSLPPGLRCIVSAIAIIILVVAAPAVDTDAQGGSHIYIYIYVRAFERSGMGEVKGVEEAIVNTNVRVMHTCEYDEHSFIREYSRRKEEEEEKERGSRYLARWQSISGHLHQAKASIAQTPSLVSPSFGFLFFI